MAAFVSAVEAAARIRDEATVVLSGNTYRLEAESVLEALEARFLADGHPRRLQVIYPIMSERARAGSGGQGTGVNRLARLGLMRRVIGGSYSRDADKELECPRHEERGRSVQPADGHHLRVDARDRGREPRAGDARRHRHLCRSPSPGRAA